MPSLAASSAVAWLSDFPAREHRRAREVRRQIEIAEREPRRLPELLHALEAAEAVVVHAPAAVGAEQARETVQDGVHVGRNVQAPPLDVVAGVDDDGEIFRRDHLLQTLHQLCAAGATGEYDDHYAALAYWCSSIAAANLSASSPPRARTHGTNSGYTGRRCFSVCPAASVRRCKSSRCGQGASGLM